MHISFENNAYVGIWKRSFIISKENIWNQSCNLKSEKELRTTRLWKYALSVLRIQVFYVYFKTLFFNLIILSVQYYIIFRLISNVN